VVDPETDLEKGTDPVTDLATGQEIEQETGLGNEGNMMTIPIRRAEKRSVTTVEVLDISWRCVEVQPQNQILQRVTSAQAEGIYRPTARIE